MKRVLRSYHEQLVELRTEGIETDPGQWLCAQAAGLGKSTLLAFADDGVIWGTVTPERCVTGAELAPDKVAPLRAVTLQAAHLFNARGEVFLWRDDSRWRARLIGPAPESEPGDLIEGFEEDYRLWGDQAAPIDDARWVWLCEGNRGMSQLVPVSPNLPQLQGQPRPCLRIRHYLKPDDEGAVRIVGSRLVELLPEGENHD